MTLLLERFGPVLLILLLIGLNLYVRTTSFYMPITDAWAANAVDAPTILTP